MKLSIEKMALEQDKVDLEQAFGLRVSALVGHTTGTLTALVSRIKRLGDDTVQEECIIADLELFIKEFEAEFQRAKDIRFKKLLTKSLNS